MSNVPKLRFKEFGGEWELKNIKSILIDSRLGGNYSNSEKINKNPLIKMGNLDRGKIVLNKIEYINEEDKINDLDKIKYGDLFFNTRNTLDLVGKVAIWRNELPHAYYNSNLMWMKFDNNFFMNYRFNSYEGIKSLRQIATGTTSVAAIYSKDLLKINLYIPRIEEQEKIASFLTSVDTKIEQLTKKEALLQEYKKGVMSKIFNQEIRFKNDEESEFPEWEEKKLGEISECLDNLRKPLNDEERQKIKGNIPYWGANNIMDYINDYIFDETIILLAEDGGNFNEYKTRPIANLSNGKCWVNNHTHVLRCINNISNNEFLFYSLVHKNITGYVSGGTRAKLTKGEMLKINISIPSIQEQTKIANFLSSIDKKIELTTKELNSTKEFKKALLQQMFV